MNREREKKMNEGKRFCNSVSSRFYHGQFDSELLMVITRYTCVEGRYMEFKMLAIGVRF